MNVLPKLSEHPWLDSMGALVAAVVMSVYAFTVCAPYLIHINSNPAMLDVIKSNKSTVDLITTAVVMFYFGASVGRRKDQDTVATLANTNAAAQAALAPLSDAVPAMTIAPGEVKTVVGEV